LHKQQGHVGRVKENSITKRKRKEEWLKSYEEMYSPIQIWYEYCAIEGYPELIL
jgi:hypothetical protein